ncbi:hypothetical protein AQ505_12720 [Pedobacter sp. PACM 27299]|uniref:hypothetical protein n=1 Tax=Pedobacter sp. PACM 27299 TaxID=1727164 RepID=UPI000705EB98|nr:hypothetical protein [Pedobacter sp. PACM 27299]ALL06282.1 hypothetical protein AQ505_12720 [Pedobacter sp. PACM 27299]
MDAYLKQRNLLVHGFWANYLNGKSETQSKMAAGFCNTFGKLSNKLESFFKGFIYFLALRHVKDRDHLDVGFKGWDNDFEFFISQVKQNKSANT